MRLSLALALTTALAIAPFALAQQADPTVSPTDFDTSAPADDTNYTSDGATVADANATSGATDPTLGAADFNTTSPTDDTSYLAADGTIPAAADPGAATTTDPSSATPTGSTPAGTTPAPGAAAKTPGFETVALLGALALAGVALRRR